MRSASLNIPMSFFWVVSWSNLQLLQPKYAVAIFCQKLCSHWMLAKSFFENRQRMLITHDSLVMVARLAVCISNTRESGGCGMMLIAQQPQVNHQSVFELHHVLFSFVTKRNHAAVMRHDVSLISLTRGLQP
jgi:hypothetical protein